MKTTTSVLLFLFVALSGISQISPGKIQMLERSDKEVSYQDVKVDFVINYHNNDSNNHSLLRTKSNNDIKQRLDSFILIDWNQIGSPYGKQKSDYFYNLDGNWNLSYTYLWDDANNDWMIDWKSDAFYDENKNQISSGSYMWDESNSLWIDFSRTEYSYDSEGNRTSTVGYLFDFTLMQMIKDLKYEYTYNFDGIMNSYIRYGFDNIFNLWVEEQKYEIVFDSLNAFLLNLSCFVWFV